MNLTTLMEFSTAQLQRAVRAYNVWRLEVLRQRLRALPNDLHDAGKRAFQEYQRNLRHLEKQEQVERIELEYEIAELERSL